ncbi:MAG TPA: hypothetical protein VKA51_04295 [Rubrobacteraceae bacterium]|nr:hypothetical protein [Rubrobacteraceae bacterium]
MRVLLKVHIPATKGSAALRDGSLQRTMEEFVNAVHPEAAYFAPDDGVRSAFFVFDMQDTSDMPPILEPLFTTFDADIELTPVMNADELRAGLQRLAG